MAHGCAGSWSSQNQVWLMPSANLSGSNERSVLIWYLSGRRYATWPSHVNGCCPLAAVRIPPQEAVYPRWSFLMMTKAFPDWRSPDSFLRLIWLATTSQAGAFESAVQPAVSCPGGPLT